MNEHNQPSDKKDVYTIVTDQVMVQLEKGIIPWRKPWTNGAMPQNLSSKRPYRGINLWLLAMLDYEQPYFLTFKQINEMGGKVKRDETGHVVIFWKQRYSETEDVPDEATEKKAPLLRYYMVFNISQCEGIPEDAIPTIEKRTCEPLLECEAIIQSMQHAPMVQSKENEAYYHPGKDFINMPKQKVFKTMEEYYAVLFHELIHSTGHESRLAREGVQQMTPFGSTVYSTEELIAEMGSCYLTHFAGIAAKPLVNSVAYIQGWLERLQNNKRILIFAASQAQKAADYILTVPTEEMKQSDVATEALVSE